MSIPVPALFMEDGTKYLLIFVGVLVVVAIARVMRGSKATQPHAPSPAEPAAPGEGGTAVEESAAETPSAGEAFAEEEVAEGEGEAAHEPASGVELNIQHGSVMLKSFYCRGFDAVKGPADPRCFYDELIVDCVNLNDGYRFDQSFLIATPEGLRQELTESGQPFFGASMIYIVDHYDVAAIRQLLVPAEEEIEEEQKQGGRQDLDLQHMLGGH